LISLDKPINVAAYVEGLQSTHSKPTVKHHLAALRMLFDWLVVGQVMDMDPAHSVRGRVHVVKKGKAPVLAADEARILLDSIDTSTVMGLRELALIALMAYTFARERGDRNEKLKIISSRDGTAGCSSIKRAASSMKSRRTTIEMGIWRHICIYKGAGLQHDPKGLVFRTVAGKAGRLTQLPLSQADAYRMIRRRAKVAGIDKKIGNHTLLATGITAYLKNGGKLEIAQQIAAHESSRTTGLYDRRDDDVNLDEVERIGI